MELEQLRLLLPESSRNFVRIVAVNGRLAQVKSKKEFILSWMSRIVVCSCFGRASGQEQQLADVFLQLMALGLGESANFRRQIPICRFENLIPVERSAALFQALIKLCSIRGAAVENEFGREHVILEVIQFFKRLKSSQAIAANGQGYCQDRDQPGGDKSHAS